MRRITSYVFTMSCSQHIGPGFLNGPCEMKQLDDKILHLRIGDTHTYLPLSELVEAVREFST